jgi:protein AATF/BFR2
MYAESAFYAIRKQQVKKRKLVDRRASKSRKIRFGLFSSALFGCQRFSFFNLFDLLLGYHAFWFSCDLFRYNVHEKITNFMAPVPMDLPPMTPKLFENLFGMSN